MLGKIISGQLQVAGDVLHTETEQIFNATQEMWLRHGWKTVYWDPIDDIEKEYIQVIEETEDSIFIHWTIQ